MVHGVQESIVKDEVNIFFRRKEYQLQARRSEIDIGGGLRAKRGKMGARGPSPGKIFQDHALFIAENALSVQITQFK